MFTTDSFNVDRKGGGEDGGVGGGRGIQNNMERKGAVEEERKGVGEGG